MMRSDDIYEIDLSRHRPSRLPAVVVIVGTIAVALIAAWVFTPFLMRHDTAAIAGLLPAPKPRPAAQEQPAATLASVRPAAAPVAAPTPSTIVAAANDDPIAAAPAAAPAPALADT